ncbi:MAG: chemotaxis protein CheW [Rectinemataceae bacterium]|nr:chemotaxis protein CheW [Spirochaetaceae bacterium]
MAASASSSHKPDDQSRPKRQACVFRTGNRFYCLDVDDIVYIYPACEVTPVPQSLPTIKGVVNIHGQIVPVLDMRMKCEHIATEIDPSHQFIMIAIDGKKLVLHVEEVAGVVHLDEATFHDAEAILPGISMISGIVKFADNLAMLYDTGAFFAEELQDHPAASVQAISGE